MDALCLEYMYGVDYGAKLAGTTVVAYLSVGNKQVLFAATEKRMDADGFLLEFFSNRLPAPIFLDAPLSLPKAYFNSSGEGDHFYRSCDRALGAMSPMFLGGLTARAIQLSIKLRKAGFHVYETYPAALAEVLNLKTYKYKKGGLSEMLSCAKIITSEYDITHQEIDIQSWHHIDALLALCSARRDDNGSSFSVGDAHEGLITV